MITLGPGEIIGVQGGTNNALAITLCGMELLAGVEAYKVLVQSLLPSGAAPIYTAPASTQVFIKSMHIANTTASAALAILTQESSIGVVASIGMFIVPANGFAFYGEDGWRIYNSDGEEMVALVSSTTVVMSDPFDNKIRNPDFKIWQRGTALGGVTSQYTADGWIVIATGAAVGVSRSANARPSKLTTHGMTIVGATSVTDVLVKQRIEGMVAAPLASRVCTFQAWVRNDTGGSITPTITIKHPNAEDAWGGTLTTDVTAASLQACANSAFTQISYTFTAHADAGNGLEITIDFGNNFSAGTKSVVVSEADLRISAAVERPSFRDYSAELLHCQRYYFRIVATATTNSDPIFLAQCYATTAAFGVVCDLPVTMRTSPTVAISNQGHLQGSTAGGGNATAFTGVTFHSSPNLIQTNNLTGGAGFGFAGQATMVFFNSLSGWIDASAEL